MKYDYLVVGTGLFGAVFAHEAAKRGKRVLAIDKRSAAGGNCRCEKIEGINVHKYGAHIFHTSDERVWEYVNSLARFNNFVNSPYAFFKGRLYSMPFNMNTFYALWGVTSPRQARERSRSKPLRTSAESLAISKKRLCRWSVPTYIIP